MRLGWTVQKGPAGGRSNAPEYAGGQEVKSREVAFGDEKGDARHGERDRNPLFLRDGAVLGIGGPARDEERSRRHRQRCRGGVGVSDREKEGELNPEHSESVENEVAPVPSVAKGSEDVFPQDEGFERKKKNARTRETKGGEVDRVKLDRLHEVLRGNAHGTPEDAGGRSERNAEDGARKHEGVSQRWKKGGESARRRGRREPETVQHYRADGKTLSRTGLGKG